MVTERLSVGFRTFAGCERCLVTQAEGSFALCTPLQVKESFLESHTWGRPHKPGGVTSNLWKAEPSPTDKGEFSVYLQLLPDVKQHLFRWQRLMELVWRLSNNQVLRKQPPGGWSMPDALLRWTSDSQLLASPWLLIWAVRERNASAPPITLISFAVLFASTPSSELSPGNRFLQFYEMGGTFSLSPVKT